MAKPTKRELSLLAKFRASIRKGAAGPILIVDGERSGVVGFGEFGPGVVGRNALRAAGISVAKHKPYRVTLLVDTWIRFRDKGDHSNYHVGDLARDPEADEGIMCSSETVSGEKRVVYQKSEVDEAGKYAFEPPIVWEGDDVGPQAIISEFWTGVGHGAT